MTETKVDLSKYENRLGLKHQMIRLLWSITWTFCASWLPRSVGRGWKNFLLRIFGAKIAKTAHVYSTAKIYYPPYLTMGENSCLASDVDCYNVAPINIGDNTTVSQGAYLCTASHDITNPLNPLITAPIIIGANTTVSQGAYLCTASHDVTSPLNPLITAPIVIEDQAWIGAKAYIGMGVTIGQGAVVGATASVYKDVEPWTIVGGNPAKFIKKRIVK